MGNQIDLGLSIMGADPTRPTRVGPQLTLTRIVRWIKAHGLDEQTTQGLIEAASRYPTHALPMFRRNFPVMLARVRSKIKKEQGVPGGTINTKEQDDGSNDSDWQGEIATKEKITTSQETFTEEDEEPITEAESDSGDNELPPNPRRIPQERDF